MSRIDRLFRGLWWLLTGRGETTFDPLITDLQAHEEAAKVEAAQSRRRQQRINVVEREYLKGRRP